MKDHISSLLKLSKEQQENGLKVLFDQIFGDLDWINSRDGYCKSIKQIFLGVELENLFYRKTSKFKSYENKYKDKWDQSLTKKVNCQNIPVYSFRYMQAFNKFFEDKFEKAITPKTVKAPMISQIFEYL